MNPKVNMNSIVVPTMMKSSFARTGHGSRHAKTYVEHHRTPRTLTRLIAKRNWFEVHRILADDGEASEIEIDEKGIITNESVVHFALRYNAPLDIIKLLAIRYPLCLTRPDSTGKFVCHVAGKYGAMPLVMEYLVGKSQTAAGVQDPAGKAPIHYVAEFYHSTNDSNDVSENMLQVVRILRDAAPESFNLEDNEGCNAIEYAIENDADLRVIKTMQRTARDDWRALKANAGGKKHEELAKDIECRANEARLNATMSDVVASFMPPSSRESRRHMKRSFAAKSA